MVEPQDYYPDIQVLPDELMTPDVRRSIIEVDLPNAINAGLGVTAARNLYKSIGVGINNTAFGNLYEQVKARITESANPVHALDLDEVVADSQREALNWQSKNRYLEQFEVSFYDDSTGDVTTSFYRYYHNDVVTIGELQQRIIELFTEQAEISGSPVAVLAANLDRSFINSRFGE